MDWTTLVSAEELASQLGAPSLRLVDARFVLAGGDADAGERAWRSAHLPGAGYVHLDRDLSDHRKAASEGRHPLPDADAFCATLERLGITRQSQVVVYDAADGAMAAARFWWLMRLLGHRRVAVLDGGFARWTELGLAIETQAPTPVTGDYRASYDTSAIATADEVMRRLGEPSGWILDARAPERFRGEVEPLDPVAGHIPGAVNRPYADNLHGGRYRPAETLRNEFNALLAGRAPGEVLLNCGSGVTACHNLLAMEHAGLHGARIYAGSWSGWISDPTRPVATT
ncbi:MAG: sulfurtransferase [Arenimonas sp.]|jgi:thiosulfate/3-mercaptopyruvate sulfurtransferase